jgi:hypothetical protein
MNRLVSAALVSSVFALAPLSAGAATFLGSSITDGLASQALNNGGITATFNAYSNATTNAAGTFEKKTIAGYTAVGVAGGRTGGELDINGQGVSEKIGVGFSQTQGIGLIEIAFLYDGPEFGDFNEVAVITASNGTVGELIATYTNASGLTAFWDILGDGNPASAVTNLSPAVDPGGAAVWRIVNPFGNIGLSGLAFTARNGVCGITPCSNQSDYSLYRIETFEPVQEIPEPSTYALMLAGLAMLGFMVRRRTQA